MSLARTAVTVHIPALYCPIPPAIHPQSRLLQERSVRWLASFGLCRTQEARDQIFGIDAADFVSRLTPEADHERMQVFVDWAHLSLLFDDSYDLLSPVAAHHARAGFAPIAVKIMRTFEAPRSAVLSDTSAFTPALHDLAHRTHAITTPVQLRRMIEAQRIWLTCVAWEIEQKTTPTPPDLNDYIVLRMGTVGGLASSSWIEILNNTQAAETDMASPPVRALAEAAGLIVGIDQDLYSYGKDLWHQQHDGTPLLNIVHVLAHAYGYSAEEALTEAVILRNHVMALFLTLRSRILPTADPHLARYVTGLGHYIRGTADWGLHVERYRNPDGHSPNAIQIHHAFTDTPPSDTFAPVPPGIAWWWDQAT
ncbi:MULTISPECIES: glutamate dehydrogenase [unclassified Streptomyces]|uniref:terpene synthase family protein n=1 Tax=unclassified Streptomyces TaxID=2593676 RepID=UPI00332B4D3D